MKDIGRVKPEELFKIDGRKKEYDIPPQMVEEFKKNFSGDGIKAVELIKELAGKYGDRTFEMVKKVAEKTGINFPHLFQSYVEFLLILAIGVEKYKVKETTTRRLFMEIPLCPLYGRWCPECERALKKIDEISKVKTKLSIQNNPEKCSLIFEPV